MNINFNTVRKDRTELLQVWPIRYTHYMERMHNSPEELEIIFVDQTLYFAADTVTPQEAKKYSDLIAAILKQKSFEGKRQDARFDALKARFGEDGITTGVEMWRYYKK